MVSLPYLGHNLNASLLIILGSKALASSQNKGCKVRDEREGVSSHAPLCPTTPFPSDFTGLCWGIDKFFSTVGQFTAMSLHYMVFDKKFSVLAIVYLGLT